LRHLGCATPDQPARFIISNSGKNIAAVVRPIVGDVDAILMQGDKVLDVSLNLMRRAELLVLPPNGRDLEVSVSSITPLASFEISLATFVDSIAPVVNADAFISQMLRSLGYDLVVSERLDNPSAIGMRRAIMAFQAGEGFPISGVIASTDQFARLLELAARQADVDARHAAEIGRLVAGRASEEDLSGTTGPVTALSTAVHNGGVYGVGKLRFGGVFEGEWFGEYQRPKVGVLRYSAECSMSLRNMASAAARNVAELMKASIGVLRYGRNILFARELWALVPRDQRAEQLQLSSLCRPPG
jgi:hypothetical protein